MSPILPKSNPLCPIKQSTPLKEMDLYVEKSVSSKCKHFSKRTLNSIEADIKKVEKEIDQLINEDPDVSRIREITVNYQFYQSNKQDLAKFAQ